MDQHQGHTQQAATSHPTLYYTLLYTHSSKYPHTLLYSTLHASKTRPTQLYCAHFCTVRCCTLLSLVQMCIVHNSRLSSTLLYTVHYSTLYSTVHYCTVPTALLHSSPWCLVTLRFSGGGILASVEYSTVHLQCSAVHLQCSAVQ